MTLHFFHRVDRLELTDDHQSIGKIHMGVQAVVTGGEEYDPLFTGPCDIPCWPDQPQYEQLEKGSELEKYTESSNNKVTLGETGHLKARVVAESITIQGEVEGDLIAEQEVVLRPSGSVVGNIVAPRVSLEKGCRFKGSIDMEKAATKAPKKQAQPKEEPVASRAETSELLLRAQQPSAKPTS